MFVSCLWFSAIKRSSPRFVSAPISILHYKTLPVPPGRSSFVPASHIRRNGTNMSEEIDYEALAAQLHARTDTSKYKMNHTMIRVKDPQRSVKFYEDNFGMTLIHRMDYADAKFSLYFLAFDSPGADSHGKVWTDREGLLELTHNYGTENDPNYKINNGNEEPYKDIAIAVDNLQQVVSDLQTAGLPHCPSPLPYKKLTSSTPDKTKWRLNHTMLRVKNLDDSIHFYSSYLGMSVLRESSNRNRDYFSQAWMGFVRERDDEVELEDRLGREGLVELVQIRGTDEDSSFKGYHNGNDQPQGFGHLCVTVDDLDGACARFDDLMNIRWKKRLTEGRMQNVAFLLDPDGYWIEIIQNEQLKKRVGW
ncbi:Glyoxalase/Bleomycin resistance protein/Dihydroxybiphenyl dioxygenase [Kalaharituber pfeilii]|nr:Glyoxalase/Bleomycin resistance protein/Dihydroxybiphenyl dioxygenase [Kalaharituber pfeilii]